MSLDAAIVIPSYKEGANILHCLASIARQRDVESCKLGIFVVINQARESAIEALASNAETARIIRDLQQRRLPLALDKRKRELKIPATCASLFGPIDEVVISLEEAAKQVLHGGIQIHEINLWEKDNAPLDCNVGIARHHGTTEAIKHLRSGQCPILGTDADAIFGTRKIRNAIDLFGTDQKLMGARGTLITLNSDSTDRRLKSAEQLLSFHQFFCELQYILLALAMEGKPFLEAERIDRSLRKIKKAPAPDKFDGINANFRADVYKDVQFRPIPGEEDYRFSDDLVKNGHKISDFGDKLATATLQRFSDRASTGMGRELEERFGQFTDDPYSFLVPSLNSLAFRVAIIKFMKEKFGFTNDATFGNPEIACQRFELIKKDSRFRRFRFDEEYLNALSEILLKSRNVAEFLNYLDNFSNSVQPCPISRAFTEIIQFIADFERKTYDADKKRLLKHIKGAIIQVMDEFTNFAAGN